MFAVGSVRNIENTASLSCSLQLCFLLLFKLQADIVPVPTIKGLYYMVARLKNFKVDLVIKS